MELTVQQALQQGVAAHNQGNLQEAERLYRTILQVQPKHPDANHNLGLIAVSIAYLYCTSSAHLAPLALQSKRYFLLMVPPV